MKKTISKATSSVISYTHWAHQKDFLCFFVSAAIGTFYFYHHSSLQDLHKYPYQVDSFFSLARHNFVERMEKKQEKKYQYLTTWKCLRKKRNMQNASEVLNHPQIWTNFFFVNFSFNAEHSDWYHWNIQNTIDKDKLWNELINQFIWNICARSQFIR